MSEARRASIVIVDASAILALLHGEPGGSTVAATADHLLMSAVNYSEVVAKLAERGASRENAEFMLSAIVVEVVPFDAAQAVDAGMLRPVTRSLGLSFGDRACLALGRQRSVPVLTADRHWLDVDLGIDIRLTRPRD